MTFRLIDYTIFSLGAGLSWMWAIALLVDRPLSMRKGLAAIKLTLVGIWQASGAYFFSGLAEAYPDFVGYDLPFLYLLPPVVYAYFSYATKDSTVWKLRDLLHILPALVAFFLVYVKGIYSQPHVGIFALISKFLPSGPKILIIAYSAAFLRKNWDFFWSHDGTSAIRKIALSFIFFIAGALAIGFTGYLLEELILIRISAYCLPLLIILVFLISRRYPQFILSFAEEAKRAKYAKSKIDNLDVNGIIQSLQNKMEFEKVFTDEDLKLSALAEELGIQSHQLSQIVNEKLGKSFPVYINEWRIQEAKAMLLAEPSRSTLSVAMAVGFNSKSAFHKAFQQFVGITPQRYREKYG